MPSTQHEPVVVVVAVDTVVVVVVVVDTLTSYKCVSVKHISALCCSTAAVFELIQVITPAAITFCSL